MADGYLTETLTYGELIERSNKIIERLREKGTLKLTKNMDAPPDVYKDIVITMRVDPHKRDIIAMQNVVTMGESEFIAYRGGLSGQGSVAFMAYYDTLSRCIHIDDCKTRQEWSDLLEADTPKADAMQDMIAVIVITYQWQIIDAEGK